MYFKLRQAIISFKSIERRKFKQNFVNVCDSREILNFVLQKNSEKLLCGPDGPSDHPHSYVLNGGIHFSYCFYFFWWLNCSVKLF